MHQYCEAREIIDLIYSREFHSYVEIKYFCAWISSSSHINIVFTMIVVDLLIAHEVVIDHDWCYIIGGQSHE